MKTYTQNRFCLQKYRGRNSRHKCPRCAKPGTFARYVDTQGVIKFPDHVGRCNREVECAYHYTPSQYFQDNPEVLTDVLGKSDTTNWPHYQLPPRASQPVPVETTKSVIHVPIEVFNATQYHPKTGNFIAYDNHLFRFLSRVYGEQEARQAFYRFCCGTSGYWFGAVVFWLIDQHFNIVGGQVVQFNPDSITCNTNKTIAETATGVETKRHTLPLFHVIKAKCKQTGQPLPQWLQPYQDTPDNINQFPYLFGMHQLAHYEGQDIIITESPKNAIIGSIEIPDCIWLSCWALDWLNPERVAPIRDTIVTQGKTMPEQIYLMPDKGGFEKWDNKAQGLANTLQIPIAVSRFLESQDVTGGMAEMGITSGYDIADYYLLKKQLFDGDMGRPYDHAEDF